MRLMLVALASAGLASAAIPNVSQAQEAIAACASQQELEQVLASDGQLAPDGCRNLVITDLESDHGQLCVLDFSAGEDPGVLDRLADAAVPTKWWVSCDALEAARP